jgi:hypothetical protein
MAVDVSKPSARVGGIVIGGSLLGPMNAAHPSTPERSLSCCLLGLLVGGRRQVGGSDAAVRAVGNDLRHRPDQVRVGVHADQSAGVDQREQRAQSLGALESSGVERVVPQERDLPQGPLAPIVEPLVKSR